MIMGDSFWKSLKFWVFGNFPETA